MPGEIICGIFASPPRPLPPFGEWACSPPAPVYLRRINALTGATVRDRESHAGPVSRKRSGVTCGSSLWRGRCGGGLSSYMPQRAFCFTDDARFPWTGGVRRPNAESYAGSRPGSVVPWAIECEIRDLVRDLEFHVRLRVGDRMSCGIRVPIRD